MNASVFREWTTVEPSRWQVAQSSQTRLRHQLTREAAAGGAWQASSLYGAPWDAMSWLVDSWQHDFELDAQALFRLPCFELQSREHGLRFVHLRSGQQDALPLLLLHGYSGSPAEFQRLLGPLTEPRAHGGAAEQAFEVVCPALPAFGLSRGPTGVRSIAAACAALMQALGHARYAVHGSDLGASIALELASLDHEHVAGLLVTSLPAYPGEAPEDWATLSGVEKSQLAGATEHRERLDYSLPRTPIEALAFALAQLGDDPSCVEDEAVAASLLTSLSLSWSLGDARARNDCYRQSRLAPAPSCDVPVAMHAFPLDAPNLRRFAERAHRVVEWHEHEQGGPMPGIEQPELLLAGLRSFFGQRLGAAISL